VVKPEWGIKRICPNCGTRYYDFRKTPPVCPACSTVYDPDALLKSRRVRSGSVEEVRKPVKVAATVEEDIEEIVPDADDADAADAETVDDDTLIEADDDDLDGDALATEVEVEEPEDDR
jgi:uncharacterized protein (TIGR02300 family)